MPKNRLEASSFSPDVSEFIALLHKHQVRYLIVGGEAVIYYGHARLTGDIDFFYELQTENVTALYAALAEFWGGTIPGISSFGELMEEGMILQFGRPPNRIDLMNRIDGVIFRKAWASRHKAWLELETGAVPLNYLGLQDLIRNKKAAGRPKDEEDARFLKQAAIVASRRKRREKTRRDNPTG